MRLLLIALSVFVFAALATGTPITSNCTLFPVTFAGGVGSTNVNCPGIAAQPPATILNSVTLTESSDYQFGSASGTNTVQVTFLPLGPAGVTWSPPSAIATSTGGISSGAIGSAIQVAATGVTLANFASPFNVMVSSAVTQGQVATSSGAVSITYDVTIANSVPETTSLILVGTGLFALGGFRLRRTRL
jgi:hypothetical protein